MDNPFKYSKLKEKKRRISFSTKYSVNHNEDSFHCEITRIRIQEHISYLTSIKTIGICELCQYYGCCGIVILSYVHVDKNYRDKKIAQDLVANAINKAKQMGYSILKATTNQHTPEMHHIFEKFGFEKTCTFTNIRTNNTVTEYTLNLFRNENQ